jgi:hypothetical protein
LSVLTSAVWYTSKLILTRIEMYHSKAILRRNEPIPLWACLCFLGNSVSFHKHGTITIIIAWSYLETSYLMLLECQVHGFFLEVGVPLTALILFSSVASFPVMVCLLLSYFYPWWVWEFGVHLIAFKFFKKIYFLQKNTLVWWRFFNLRQNKGICGATEDFLGFGIIPWDSLDYTRSKQTISHGRKNIMDTLAWRVLHWGY